MPLPSRQLHRLGAVKGAERVRGSKREVGICPQVDGKLLMVAVCICKGMSTDRYVKGTFFLHRCCSHESGATELKIG